MRVFLNSIACLVVFVGFSPLLGSMKDVVKLQREDATYSSVWEIDVDETDEELNATMAGLCRGLEAGNRGVGEKLKSGNEEKKN